MSNTYKNRNDQFEHANLWRLASEALSGTSATACPYSEYLFRRVGRYLAACRTHRYHCELQCNGYYFEYLQNNRVSYAQWLEIQREFIERLENKLIPRNESLILKLACEIFPGYTVTFQGDPRGRTVILEKDTQAPSIPLNG